MNKLSLIRCFDSPPLIKIMKRKYTSTYAINQKHPQPVRKFNLLDFDFVERQTACAYLTPRVLQSNSDCTCIFNGSKARSLQDCAK